MRTAMTALFMLALTVPAIGKTRAATGPDEKAIRRVVQQQDDARNRGDWKALGQLFAEDADQQTSAGDWRRGRTEIEKGVAQTMGTAYKGGKYATKIERVQMLGPGVAIADGAFEIANIGGGARRGRTTYILVKSGDQWRIAAIRSMVPTPVGATPSR